MDVSLIICALPKTGISLNYFIMEFIISQYVHKYLVQYWATSVGRFETYVMIVLTPSINYSVKLKLLRSLWLCKMTKISW